MLKREDLKLMYHVKRKNGDSTQEVFTAKEIEIGRIGVWLKENRFSANDKITITGKICYTEADMIRFAIYCINLLEDDVSIEYKEALEKFNISLTTN